MKKISSGSTVFYKRLFPLLWFGGMAVFVVRALSAVKSPGDLSLAVAGPILMAVIGFFLFRKVLWDLVDEVHDGGDFLLIRKGGEEERVPLSNIMNVSASTNASPPRITLRLVKPGKFGSEVAFAPQMKFSFSPVAKSPVADDLIVRAYEARRS